MKTIYCEVCFGELDFKGNCPICQQRKSHIKKKALRQSKKDKSSSNKSKKK